MSNKTTELFSTFPAISTEEWKNKITVDLKGGDFDKKLVWKSVEGLTVQPFYRQDNLDTLGYLDTLPGQFPYVRGTKKTNNEWFIRQDVVVTSPAAGNAKALDVLMKGVTSVGFVIEDTKSWTAADVATLLKGIEFSAIEVCFVIGTGKTNFTKLFVDYIAAQKINAASVRGSINCDYLGKLALTGAFCCGSEGESATTADGLFKAGESLPNFKTLEVHADYFQNAGANAVQELAFGLAVGAQYLTNATEKGAAAGKFAKKMKFNFAVGSSYFVEIAKLRAARMLWAKIVDAYNPAECDCKEACQMEIHSVTATWNKTVYDPYVNMLRTQTEAMSAVIGGANSLTVLPFNSIFAESNDFSERIARNQQSLLKEESYMDKIVDPSAGSYYIESLTDMIAEKAWDLFLQVQDKGGFTAALTAGFIQSQVAETAKTREQRIAQRRDNLLGTNQFPNFNELLEEKLDVSLFQKKSAKAANAVVEPLQMCRGAQAFELLRYKTDQWSKTNGRPTAFMFTIGNLTMRKARSLFSCNFFACAGIKVVDNNGFATVDEGVAAAKASGAQIIVICSSDDEYATLAPEIFEKLKDKIVVVAGEPTCAEELKAKGLQNFISVRSNVLETLQKYQQQLGIA